MAWYYWLILGMILFVIEILTPGVFFFACLGIGAVCASFSSLLDLPAWFPWIIFAVTSILSIYFVRPLAKKIIKFKPEKSNVDALIGQIVLVVEAIEPPNMGMVKVEGELWRAEANEKIEKDNKVKIIAIKGTHLEVTKT